MSISASQVKELREMTGVGMMECKKALVETDGDLEKALELFLNLHQFQLCLLYTSPSPRDLSTSRMPSSA